MLIMTKDREILNLDNVLEIRANEENVECELMNGYIYTIQSFKTHKKAGDALDKILKQYCNTIGLRYSESIKRAYRVQRYRTNTAGNKRYG